MEKTATSDNYISNHFPDTTLLCSPIFQKQCMSYKRQQQIVNTRSTNSPNQMLQRHNRNNLKPVKRRNSKIALKAAPRSKVGQFTSMIEDLGLYKAISDKPFFVQVMVLNFYVKKLCWLDNPENTHRFQLMVSPFSLQALAQCNNSLLFYVRRFRNGIFSFSEDITLAKIECNKVEAGLHVFLKHHYSILGHCEHIPLLWISFNATSM